MIIVQTPLRVSFFGGGTDFPSFYKSEGGCVLSSSIDKYIFVTIKQRFDDFVRVGYTSTEIVDSVSKVQHELIREALLKTGITKAVEITTMGDIPAGSGLGSSSAVTVGALQAMYSYLHETVLPRQLADEASEIEVDILKKPMGKQDQFISAFGGLRMIEFQKDGCVNCERVDIDPAIEQRFNESLMLFFTGVTRQASSILEEQNQNTKYNYAALHEIKKLPYIAREYLCDGNLEAFGRLLDESWKIKKQLASQISNTAIEDYYQRAKDAGAWGGKIAGAGGGGFLLLLCPIARRDEVRSALKGLRELPFQLTKDGSKVIFNHIH